MIDLQMEIEISEFAYDITHQGRIVNQIVKSALSEELVKHHEQRIPKHFERPAHQKYGYADRSKKYIGIKVRQFHHGEDLVRTEKAKTEIVRERRAITVGGDFTKPDGAVGKLKLRFPHPTNKKGGLRKDGKPKVDGKQMSRELTAISTDEKKDIAQGFGGRVARKFLIRKYGGPRVRFYKSK